MRKFIKILFESWKEARIAAAKARMNGHWL